MSHAEAPEKRRGRSARMAARAIAATPENPAAPGQNGGQYRPLTDPQIAEIYNAALRLLSQLGMGEAPPVLVEAACKRGAQPQRPRAALFFPVRWLKTSSAAPANPSSIMAATGNTISRSVVRGRISGPAVRPFKRWISIAVSIGPPPCAISMIFTRLQDTLTNVSWFTRCCVATDVPDLIDLDVNTAYALLRGDHQTRRHQLYDCRDG